MKLYQKSELTHSRIFFDKKPPMFLTVFIFSVIFILVIAYFISSMLIRTYVVNAQGTVVAEDTTFLASFTDGVLVELIKPEGSFVETGDILFTVSSGQEGLQYQTIQAQLDQQESLLATMDLFEQSLNEGRNLMENEGISQEYHARVEHYLLAREQDSTSQSHLGADLTNARNNVTRLNQEISDIEGNISQLNEQETNLQAQLSATPQEIEEIQEVAVPDTEIGEDDVPIPTPAPIMIPNPEHERLTGEIAEVVAKREGLEGEIEGKRSEITGAETEITQLERQLESTSAEQTRIQLLAELGSSRTSAETRIAELESQITAHQAQDGLYEVRANHTGYLHYLVPVREGMMIQRMQTMAEISEHNIENMQVEAFIPAHQISRVEVGQDVNVAIDGVNVQKFGTILGSLSYVDSGTMAQETPNGTQLFYRGIVEINEHELVASNGDVVSILRSMPVSARIVYDRETYLDWLLNVLNFRNE